MGALVRGMVPHAERREKAWEWGGLEMAFHFPVKYTEGAGGELE